MVYDGDRMRKEIVLYKERQGKTLFLSNDFCWLKLKMKLRQECSLKNDVTFSMDSLKN